MGLLTNKRAVIVGLASDRSIAWGIATAMRREGAELILVCQNDKLKDRVMKLAAALETDIVLPCDVGNDAEIEALFAQIDDYWDHIDILVHSVAFAPREALQGDYLDAVTRAGFHTAHDISSYSFAALAKAARPMMQNRSASMLTLSYLGAERVIPNYNVMGVAKASLEANVRYMANSLGPEGIRVNAISAGPIRTLAASGIADFRAMLNYAEQKSPLRRNVTIEEVGNIAAFLGSDWATAITGEVIYADAGFHIVGMV